MPTIKPSRKSESFELPAGLATIGTPMDLEQRIQNALDTLNQLDSFRPKTYPERPEVLTYDDNQLYEAYQSEQHGKVSKAAGEQLRYFASWRSAVWRIEAHSEGNLIALASAIHNLELGGEHSSEIRILRAFVRDHYRCALPDPVPGVRSWIERWAGRFAQNRRVLPLHMRTMSRPPIGEGGRKSGEQQQYMDYGADENEPGF